MAVAFCAFLIESADRPCCGLGFYGLVFLWVDMLELGAGCLLHKKVPSEKAVTLKKKLRQKDCCLY